MIEGADRELLERSLHHATQRYSGPQLDAALAEIGWIEAFEVDQQAAVSIYFEMQGRANVTSAALCHTAGALLDRDAAGAVLPAFGGWDPPGRLDGGHLHVDGLWLGEPGSAEHVSVVYISDEAESIASVPSSLLTFEPIVGLDSDLGLSRVVGLAPATTGLPADWRAVVDVARLALGHEMVGAAHAMLELARTHALDRVQFGQPIAGFQAVRHRLAETYVAIESAQAALDAAWLEPTSQSVAMAKAVAGRSSRTVAKHCQQVLAGIGFTTEHPFHRYLRRILVLDEVFGSARSLTRALGSEAIATGRIPAILPL